MLRVKPWQTFWWFVALIVAFSILLWNQGVVKWFMEHYGSPETLVVSGGMLALFVVIFFWKGLSVAIYLHREYHLLMALRQSLVNQGDASGGWMETMRQGSHSGLSRLHTRMTRYQSVTTSRPIDEEHLMELYEDDTDAAIQSLEHFRQLLFFLGLFGTIAGIVYALGRSSEIIPETPDQVREFSFGTLSGLGVAYTSSFFGLAGAIVLFLLIGQYRKWANYLIREVGEEVHMFLRMQSSK